MDGCVCSSVCGVVYYFTFFLFFLYFFDLVHFSMLSPCIPLFTYVLSVHFFSLSNAISMIYSLFLSIRTHFPSYRAVVFFVTNCDQSRPCYFRVWTIAGGWIHFWNFHFLLFLISPPLFFVFVFLSVLFSYVSQKSTPSSFLRKENRIIISTMK